MAASSAQNCCSAGPAAARALAETEEEGENSQLSLSAKVFLGFFGVQLKFQAALIGVRLHSLAETETFEFKS